jgi:hypothetical protein
MFGVILAAFLSAQSADTAYTLHLRARGGYREANPVLTNSTARLVLTKAAITTTGAVAAYRWRKTHPKAARLILIVGTASATAATAWNVRHARR